MNAHFRYFRIYGINTAVYIYFYIRKYLKVDVCVCVNVNRNSLTTVRHLQGKIGTNLALLPLKSHISTVGGFFIRVMKKKV
jgi:hypothetical protein